jgi:alpha-tubulin suppressor-like RCC1 family protein
LTTGRAASAKSSPHAAANRKRESDHKALTSQEHRCHACNLGVGSGNGILYSPTQTLNPGSGIIQLAVGYDDVLGLRSDGTVVAWGNNSNGQLGDGTTTTRVTPVQVSGLSGVSQVSAGFDYSLAVHTTKVISR